MRVQLNDSEFSITSIVLQKLPIISLHFYVVGMQNSSWIISPALILDSET